MCGIYGELVTGEAAREPAGSLEPVLAALHHRGPDARGTFAESRAGWRVRLAHTRLRILDLSERAAQPMASADASLRLVYNGEIYDFLPLRRELEGLGHVFRSSGDTEVVLAALAEWGPGALPRLRGMFAFALYDARDGSLLVARDRLGVKPLYFAHAGERFAAASEVGALLAGGAVEFRPDPEAVGSYLAFGSVSGPRTMAQGVVELPPGHWLRFQDVRARMERYWDLPRRSERPPSESDAVQEVRRLVRSAVRSHLAADVPVGAFLSSGMDSSAVVSCAAEVLPGRLDAFTVAFGEAGGALNEDAEAARLAASRAARHHVLVVEPSWCLDSLEDVLAALDQPSMDGVNTFVISQEVKRAGVTVALSGVGGDEVFGGYPNLRSAHDDAVAYGALRSLGPLLRVASRMGAPLAGRDVRVAKALALLASGGDPAAVYAVTRALFLLGDDAGLLSPDYAAQWRGGNRAFLSSSIPPPGDLAEAQTAFELRNYLPNTLLRDTDVMSMRHALEVRVPLLDGPLVDFVLSLPTSYRFKRGRQKALLAAAFPEVPKTPPRAKKGFTLPFASWFQRELRGDVERRLARLEHAGEYVTTRGATALWRRFVSGESRLWTRVWAIYVLDRWLERQARRVPASASPRHVPEEDGKGFEATATT